jgi:hypothetical protein
MIRRAIFFKNTRLFQKFGVNPSLENPKLFIVINSHDSIKDKKFIDLETFVANMSREVVHNAGMNIFIIFKLIYALLIR